MIDYDELAEEIEYTLSDIKKLQGVTDIHSIKRLARCRKQLQLLIHGDYYGFWKNWRKGERAQMQTIYRWQKYRKRFKRHRWIRSDELANVQKLSKVKRRGLP